MRLPARYIALAATVILQLAVALSLVTYTVRVKSDAQKNARVIAIACRAYDPYSPFKGRYVHLSFDISTAFPIAAEEGTAAMVNAILTEQGDSRQSQTLSAYCRVEPESSADDALWTVTAFRRALPKDDGNVYLQTKITVSPYTDSLSPAFNFHEYYMQEDYARFVDKIQWNDFNELSPVLSLYVDKKGRCVQKGLTVIDSGKRISIEEYCRRKINGEKP